MELDRDLAEAEFAGNLFVHEALRDKIEDLAFTPRQFTVESKKITKRLPFPAALAIKLDRLRYHVKYVLVAERFGEEIDRAGLECANRHRHVAMAGGDDD